MYKRKEFMYKRKKPKNERDKLCTAPLMGPLQAVPGSTNHKKSAVLNVPNTAWNLLLATFNVLFIYIQAVHVLSSLRRPSGLRLD